MDPNDRSLSVDCCHLYNSEAHECFNCRNTMRSVWSDAAWLDASSNPAIRGECPGVSIERGPGRIILCGYAQSNGGYRDCTDGGANLLRYGRANDSRTDCDVRPFCYLGNRHSSVYRFDANGGRRTSMIVVILISICLFALSFSSSAKAEEMQKNIDKVIDGIDFRTVDGLKVDYPGMDQPVGIKEAIRLIVSGNSIMSEDILSLVISGFLRQVARLGTLALSIILPATLSSLTNYICLEGKRLQLLGKSLLLVLILVPVVVCVFDELEHTRLTIISTTERMDRILPLLLTLLTAVGGSASSAFLHPVVVAASGSMVYLAREVILRLVMCTCAVTTVNHLSSRMHLTRMARLLRSAVCWLLGVSFTVFLGAMSVQGVCSATADGVTIRAAKYAVDNFVPIVGGMFSDTMDTLVGCTLIVKNALGITAILVLSGAMLMPMIRTFAVAAVIKICTAFLEPIAQPEVITAIEDFSGTIVLFLITLLCVCTMYFLLIVQLLLMGNLTVMLR